MKTFKVIDWVFFIIGLAFFWTLWHETYHYLFCGGDFIAGFAYLNGESWLGATWCAIDNNAGWEVIPTTLEAFLLALGIYAKVKYENKKGGDK